MSYTSSHLLTACIACIATGVATGATLLTFYNNKQRTNNTSSTVHHSKPTQLVSYGYKSNDKDKSNSTAYECDLSHADWEKQYQYMTLLYDKLINDFIDYIKNEHQLPSYAIERLKRLFSYTILGGKYNRALLVTNSVKIICNEYHTDSRIFSEKAIVLGWCIEILQALFLVADDIMDSSVTRRGKPCWYRLPDIQLDAVNDTLILEALMYYLLNTYFQDTKQHVAIIKLFQEVTLNTEMGQMLDLLSQPQGRKGNDILHSFNIELYNKIVKYKTCLYSFYLPIASALILYDIDNLHEALNIGRELSIELGTKFQIQDDYLDAFQDPIKLGKIGTDIRDHKCSWLVVQALQRCNTQQMKVLEQNYGKESGEERIKELYRELKLPELYEEQENQSYERIIHLINANEHILPKEIGKSILDKIHKREK